MQNVKMGEHLPSATVSWPPLVVNLLFHPHVTPVAMDYKQEFASTYLTGRGSITVKIPIGMSWSVNQVNQVNPLQQIQYTQKGQ